MTRPWSLSTLAPSIVAHLDEHPEDFVTRLVAADLVEEAGFPEAAQRIRWAARGGQYPNTFSAHNRERNRDPRPFWYWIDIETFSGFPREFFPHVLPGILADGFTNYSETVHDAPTRQECEDDLTEHLLRFDDNPFADNMLSEEQTDGEPSQTG